MKLILAIPHSHSWFWTQTCISALKRFPPKYSGVQCQIVVVDNSAWSPAIRGITDTDLGKGVIVHQNAKTNPFHASALDDVVDKFDFDYLMAWETDVLPLRHDWLSFFMDRLQYTDFAVGHWHHESFINPSCTLYRGHVLRKMKAWCMTKPEPDVLRWGPGFETVSPLDSNIPSGHPALQNMLSWVAGPFADKRGWPAGTMLKEPPSGQCKGPGWYEPGQMLHHWAVEEGYTYTVCPTHSHNREPGMPVQTLYGATSDRELNAFELLDSGAATVHLWGGTRALDIIKHDVTCEFVKGHTAYWLGREANFWRDVVPHEIQQVTLDLIRQYGWHYRGQGADHVSDRDRAAAAYVKECYAKGGVTW